MTQPRTPRERFERFVEAARASAPSDDSTAEANKALVERYFEMWNTGDGLAADAVLAPTYLDHAHPEVIGPGAVRALVPRFHNANPEARLRIEIAAADGEFVAVRKRISGGKAAEGIAVFRVIAGKVAEQWGTYLGADGRDLTPTTVIDWLWFRA